MGVSVAGSQTRVLTSEIELIRLVRLVLGPRGCIVGPDESSWTRAKSDGPCDIVIVDLPGLDLDELRRAQRAYSDAVFIAVCGSYHEADCIAVLDLDADYLARPFRPQDLAARVRVAELRRFTATGRRRYYRRGSFLMDLLDRHVAVEGERIALASTELRILTLLASGAGQVATYGRILAGLGRADSASGRRALRASVFRLRRRIEREPRRPKLLLTEARVGYRLAPEADDALDFGARAPCPDQKEDSSL